MNPVGKIFWRGDPADGPPRIETRGRDGDDGDCTAGSDWSGREPVYLTVGLAEALLHLAAEAEPSSITMGLGVTPARKLETGEGRGENGEGDNVEEGAGLGLDPDTAVFTHFYHPDAGRSVDAVFGMDLSTPVGTTRGRFVSHPQGPRAVQRTDDLHAVIIVAVPPWEPDMLAAFDRRGRRRPLRLLDVEPPQESIG